MHEYCTPMGMLEHLGTTLRHARRHRRVQATRVAGHAGIDVATLYRFERGEAWPRDPERIVDAYAVALRTRPVDLWAVGVRGWLHKEDGQQPGGEG